MAGLSTIQALFIALMLYVLAGGDHQDPHTQHYFSHEVHSCR
jgi:hypothetical protein